MGFHGEVLLVPRPTPKLEDHSLSIVRECLFNLFAAILHITTWGRAKLWWQGPTYHGHCVAKIHNNRKARVVVPTNFTTLGLSEGCLRALIWAVTFDYIRLILSHS